MFDTKVFIPDIYVIIYTFKFGVHCMCALIELCLKFSVGALIIVIMAVVYWIETSSLRQHMIEVQKSTLVAAY